jgi:hypothetical protein
MKLDTVMGTADGQAWAKALYMATVGNDGQPWASSYAWADGQHDDGRSFMPDGIPHDARLRPNRKQATSWLRLPASSSRTALFHDGRAASRFAVNSSDEPTTVCFCFAGLVGRTQVFGQRRAS